MVDSSLDAILVDLPKALTADHGMELVTGGRAAGFATIELMRRTRAAIKPKEIVDAYGVLEHPIKSAEATALLWKKFGKGTVKVMADGCRTLAMIWESAWVEGEGHKIPKSQLRTISRKKLRGIYEDQGFLPSKALGQIDSFL